MAHTALNTMINDCSHMDMGTVTLIDVTVPMRLLIQGLDGFAISHD